MKKNYICFFLFSIFLTLFSVIKVGANGPLTGKTFVVDAGHGGVDPGVVVGSTYEKDVNLKISLALKKELENLGAKVILTREGDYDLGTPSASRRKKSDFDHRISIVNKSKADYFVSIHLNYLSDSSYFGPQVFYNSKLEVNQTIANQVQNFLNSKLGTHRESKRLSHSIYMYSRLNIPGVLVECGFLSNSQEKSLLLDNSYIEQFTKYLAESFLNL